MVTLSLQRLSDLSKVMRLKRIRSLESLPSVAISRDPAPPSQLYAFPVKDSMGPADGSLGGLVERKENGE